VFTWLIRLQLAKWRVLVLKDDSMVQHHMGPNQMHPDRSSCLGLSANGWMSQDQVFWTFSEQMLRSVYCTVHALGLVPASTLPWVCTGWNKPYTRGGGVSGGYWGLFRFELPACYHPNLGIFKGVWLFQNFFFVKMYPTPVKSFF
jgi:hypothetical protein